MTYKYMARLAGIELQDNWRLPYALTKIKGVGQALAREIVDSLKLDYSKRVSDLSPEEVSKIALKLEDYTTEGDLVKQVRINIQRLKNTGSYRGLRHTRGLPVRGQRTRSNARTKRGRRKTVGAFRKEALAKMQQTKTRKVEE